jgi:hypothetical protein
MLMAVFALGATAAATASASERGVLTLKEEKVVLATGENLANIGTLKAGGGGAGKEITCKKLWVLDVELGPVAGSAGKHFNLSSKDTDIHFGECKSGAANCSTAGDAAGVILVLVLVHLVNLLDKEGGTLVPGFAALVLSPALNAEGVKITCGLVLTALVKGAAKGLVEPLNAKNEITLTEEVEKVGFIAREKVVCDPTEETVCQKLLKEEPLVADLGAGPLAATEVTELETLTLKPAVLWDD